MRGITCTYCAIMCFDTCSARYVSLRSSLHDTGPMRKRFYQALSSELGAQQYLHHHRSGNYMASCVGIQGNDSFLYLALQARGVGETYRKGSVPGTTCLCHRSLANLGTIMIEDCDAGELSRKGRVDPAHLHGTRELLRVLWRGESHTI